VKGRFLVFFLIFNNAIDFDGVSFHVSNPDGEKSKLRVSIHMKFYSDLQKYGADQVSSW
jgi:hypothetical protein